MTVDRGDGRGCEGAAAAQILGDLMDERHGFTGAMQHHFGKDAALVAGQALAQPAIDDLKKEEIGLVAIHDAGAGIDIGLDRIRLDQALAEAVDGRAGDFVDRGARGREIAALCFERPPGSATRSSAGILPAERSATNSRTRESSSLAASSVKVTAAMARGAMPSASIMAMRPAMTAVLPEPAPASTRKDRS